MTLSCNSTDFENDSDFRPSRARCCLRFRLCRSIRCVYRLLGNDSNLLIVFYVQIMPDDFVMQLHRF